MDCEINMRGLFMRITLVFYYEILNINNIQITYLKELGNQVETVVKKSQYWGMMLSLALALLILEHDAGDGAEAN